MSSILSQREYVNTLKKDTTFNIGLLNKFQPLPREISSILKENVLEKPTQSLFYHLTYYLISIIDVQAHTAFTWPLYDMTADGRKYRNELYSFINNYRALGLLSPVMASYLVNPACFKVTLLLFQLSHLAIKQVILIKMDKSKTELYNSVTEKYSSKEKQGFSEETDKVINDTHNKIFNYLCKKEKNERIACLLREKIVKMENILSNTNAMGYINNFVDNFINNYEVSDDFKSELLQIKNIDEESSFFDKWLENTDKELDKLESRWDIKVGPVLKKSKDVYESTSVIVKRNTGEIEKSSYMLEYDPKHDRIVTEHLEAQANIEQKYVLQNIEKDGKLNFPNLLRAFVISVGFIFKNNPMNTDIVHINPYLEETKMKYDQIVFKMRDVIQRLCDVETKYERSPIHDDSISFKDIINIPPIPDLSNLKTSNNQILSMFTPLNLRKNKGINFAFKPQSRLNVTSYYPREDFLRTTSCRVNAYDTNLTQYDVSVISSIRVNETIASSAFTKEQLTRLLSSRKSSSSKKFKIKRERSDTKTKKELFNESFASNDGKGLFRSHSSPNLFENREKRAVGCLRGRRLSIMKEDSPILEVSGITNLDSDSKSITPHGLGNAESSRILSLPCVKINDIMANSSDEIWSPILENSNPKPSVSGNQSKQDTPKLSGNVSNTKVTASLEKIINRFKKVRASVVPMNDRQVIFENKENAFSANRFLLPDLVSPINGISSNNESLNESDSEEHNYGPRQSLGAMLGVDNTFLDQFDLID